MKTIQTLLILAATIITSSAFALGVTDGGPPTTTPAEATHDCLAIVVDASGSMDEGMDNGKGGEVRKIDAAKVALKSVIDQIPSNTHVGVLLFVGSSFGGQRIDWLTPIGPLNKDPLKAAIDGITPGGGTPLGQSIKLAADALIDARVGQHNYGTYQLLVVTDGEATDRDLMQTYAPLVVQSGIQFDVIGVGMPGRHMLATTAHRYWSANDTVTLNAALKTAVQAESKGGAAAQADYDLLNGLPDDVAKGWLTNVTNMDLQSWHIGEQKPEPSPAAGTAQANALAKADQAAPANPEKKCDVPWPLIVIGIVALFVVAAKFVSEL